MKANERPSEMSSTALLKRGLLVEYVSVAWMIVEALGAIAAGVIAGSLALLAFGGDSIIELASSITVVRHLRTEGRGEGNDDKTEWTERATLLLLFVLIPVIGLGTACAFVSGIEPESSVLGILIGIGAIVIMPALWFEKRRIGRRSNCLPIAVDASESAACFLMSAALLAGLITNLLWHFWWVDYIATVVIILFLGREAVESFHSFRNERQRSIF